MFYKMIIIALITKPKLECEHDIITHDANSLSWTKLWEFLKWQSDIVDEVIITKIIVFDIPCYAD